jgi:hypothetical protein
LRESGSKENVVTTKKQAQNTPKGKLALDQLVRKKTVRDDYNKLAKSKIKLEPGAVKNFVHNF